MKFSPVLQTSRGWRSNNEDAATCCFSRSAVLLVVADGLGGHFGGEIASQLAIETITKHFQSQANPSLNDVSAFLHESFALVHEQIRQFTLERKLSDSPRTTCTACVIQDGTLTWANSGDSRFYWLRRQQVIDISKDHTTVQALIDSGKISHDEAAKHPYRNRLYNCLGGLQHKIKVDVSTPGTIKTGDVIMLCTDGLWAFFESGRLGKNVDNQNLRESIKQLMRRAVIAGSPNGDNLTVAALSWDLSNEAGFIDTEDLVHNTHGLVPLNNDDLSAELDAEFATKMDDQTINEAINEIRSAMSKFKID